MNEMFVLLLTQIAQYNGYIQVNWNRVERSVTEAKERFHQGSARNFPAYFESVSLTLIWHGWVIHIKAEMQWFFVRNG